MPVRNAGPYLDEAIESILAQTFTDFEFVILDDASTDGSRGILRNWAGRDSRIRLIESAPLGLVTSANAVAYAARGLVCARMDADDVSLPERLRVQWELLSAAPDVVAVATLWDGIDAQGRSVRPRDRWPVLRETGIVPFWHGSLMFRRDAFEQVGGYRAATEYWEDVDLCARLGAVGRIMLLPDLLYRHRFHRGSSTGRAAIAHVARSIGRMHHVLGRARRDGATGGPDTSASEHAETALHPGALAYVAMVRLWAGDRPGILLLLTAASPRILGAAALKAWTLAIVGGASPKLARLALRGFVALRDRVASWRVREGVPVEWRAGSARRRRTVG
jgi:GT2 family glycosyltransferase